MIAVDTNVIVRLFTGDNARQTAVASALLDREELYVATTVVLEAEWVLRKVYHLDPNRIVEALKAFISLPQVRLEAPERVFYALRMIGEGLDFADALHRAAAIEADCEQLATFDRDFARRATGQEAAVRLL